MVINEKAGEENTFLKANIIPIQQGKVEYQKGRLEEIVSRTFSMLNQHKPNNFKELRY